MSKLTLKEKQIALQDAFYMKDQNITSFEYLRGVIFQVTFEGNEDIYQIDGKLFIGKLNSQLKILQRSTYLLAKSFYNEYQADQKRMQLQQLKAILHAYGYTTKYEIRDIYLYEDLIGLNINQLDHDSFLTLPREEFSEVEPLLMNSEKAKILSYYIQDLEKNEYNIQK